MLGGLVFVVAFLFFLMITLLFPSLPPGQIICDVLGNSETNYSLAEFSGELVIASIINGLIWGVITIMLYSYLRGPSKEKISLPIWFPRYATSHSSKTENKSTEPHEAPSFHETRKMQDLKSIEGIGYIYAFRLKKLDINTVDDLVNVASTKAGRHHLANLIGVTPSTVLNWIRQAEARSKDKKFSEKMF